MAAAAWLAFVAGLAAPAWGAPEAETLRIGTTAGGRPLEVVAIGEPGTDQQGRSRDQRPALLIVAGLRGDHAIGTRAAREVGERLVRDHPDLLATRTVYVVARANPDGAARWGIADPKAECGRAPQTQDQDGDGRTDEDPPNDLNGDGLITMMRVPAPNPAYGLEARYIADPDDPRLSRAPKPADGETGAFALLIEGVDDDGDGAFNEDGWGGASGGGIDMDRCFPTHWPERSDGSGVYPLELPEARALVEWTQSRPNIVAVLVYGTYDTLGTVPPAGKYGAVGEVSTGIEDGDKAYYEKISEAYKAATGVTKGAGDADRAGSFLQWSYADLGVWAFGSPVWTRPDLTKKADADDKGKDDEPKQSAQDAALADAIAKDRAALSERGVAPELIDFIFATPEERQGIMGAMDQMPDADRQARLQMLRTSPMDVQQRVMALAQGKPDPLAPKPEEPAPEEASGKKPDAKKGDAKKKRGDSDDARWLAWIDDERAGEGFVAWTPVDHPQLGRVEIGGFVPDVRVNPPEDLVAPLLDAQASFVATLLGDLPTLEVDEPTVERVGEGLWRVSISARNTGLLPTVSASGVKAERLPGLVFVFDPEQTVKGDRIVAGRRFARFDTLAGSGASARYEWLVACDAGTGVRVEVRSGQFGSRGFDVRMGGGR